MIQLKKDGFASSEEVGKWLGLSPRTITALAEKWRDSDHEEGLPGFKVGRAWRFDPHQLEAWLMEQQLGGRANASTLARAGSVQSIKRSASSSAG